MPVGKLQQKKDVEGGEDVEDVEDVEDIEGEEDEEGDKDQEYATRCKIGAPAAKKERDRRKQEFKTTATARAFRIGLCPEINFWLKAKVS